MFIILNENDMGTYYTKKLQSFGIVRKSGKTETYFLNGLCHFFPSLVWLSVWPWSWDGLTVEETGKLVILKNVPIGDGKLEKMD